MGKHAPVTVIPELGMYYYKARIYSPTLGRFMQTDPIGYKDGLNIYAYVGNDPVNKVDPSGKYECQGKGCGDFKKALAYASRVATEAKTGTRIPSSNLKAAVNFFGKEGKGGPNITFNNEKAGTLGSFSRSDSGSTVNFDLKQIGDVAKSAGASSNLVLGGVLVHEGRHGTQRAPSTSQRRFSNELEAYTTEALFYKAAGMNDPSRNPSYTTKNGINRNNIRRGALGSCSTAVFATSQNDGGCAAAESSTR